MWVERVTLLAMKKNRTSGALAVLVSMSLLSACLPSDTKADSLAAELEDALSAHTLQDVPLVNAEAAASFATLVEPLRDFPVQVTAGEINYDMNDAVLPLQWAWAIGENTWEYATTVDLEYEERQWWATWTPESFIPGLEPGQRIGVDTRAEERAEILAADGRAIITSRPILRFGLDKPNVPEGQMDDAAEQVAKATGVDPEWFIAKVNASGPKAFVEAISVRPDEVDEWVDDDFAELPGALIVSAEALLGPTRTFARELLGRAGQATAEIIEQSDGLISAGDIVGLSGLQKQYDPQLRGEPAVEIFTVDASDCKDPLECESEDRIVLETLNANAPTDLGLSIDVEVQIAAESALEGAYEGADSPEGASLVAIRPSTGEIIALANGEGNEGLNHASVGQYPPGSTFKVVTALALLRSGLDPQDRISCPETTVVDGREFKNYDGYPSSKTGEITFLDAFAASCNTALIELRGEITGEDLVAAAHSLGFGLDLDGSDLGFPAFLGDLPSAGEGTAFAAALIGQGEVLASPLAMALVAASVQAGHTVVPHLISGTEAEVPEGVSLSAEEAAQLQELMEAVVTDGTASALGDLGGDVLRAKTGTAEHGEESSPPHAWIIGSHGDVSVSVFVESGVGGAQTAGPVLEQFLQEIASD